ncbi:FMN-binding negative transcriptional regulator [Nonomuraea phyllanthi]|uniref:FMN-binding negative transcriptional regulator n=1 Tax=Nonomuraea phyllanthi TaxID=2219224 RepID=UPI0037421D60
MVTNVRLTDVELLQVGRPGTPSCARRGSPVHVFPGPRGYVSPTPYATDPAVPIRDYAAVHVTGPGRADRGRDGRRGAHGRGAGVAPLAVLGADPPRRAGGSPPCCRG